MHSAFDTLAKALNPNEEGEGQSLSEAECVGGATIQVISRDQVTPLIEVEGPLLTDTHVNFKVRLYKQVKHLWHIYVFKQLINKFSLVLGLIIEKLS